MDFRPGEKTRDGYLALPPSGSGPGVVVFHAWWGLNEFVVELCDRLAAEGFVALAPDLSGGAVAVTIPEAEALKNTLNFSEMGEKALGACDFLSEHPGVTGDKIGAMGFSMGAESTLLLATKRSESVAASVLFYGVGEADFTQSRCAYLCHFGEDDEWDPVDQAREMEARMRAAGRDVTLHVYPGAGHWFFEANQPDAYVPEAAQLAWDRTVSFLNTQLL
ncbi:MAG: dienelactone hydrolase family protein [Capsulimonas sp.]|uniref:dienelactone hydrolase family protein n=1 Tax=Capsulimonas sp. TaxID=2494211 RepID=UPI003266B5A3